MSTAVLKMIALVAKDLDLHGYQYEPGDGVLHVLARGRWYVFSFEPPDHGTLTYELIKARNEMGLAFDHIGFVRVRTPDGISICYEVAVRAVADFEKALEGFGR